MKEGKHEKKKVKLIEKYTVLLLIATLFMSIGYADIIDQEMTITGTTTAEAQDEVFITEVTTTDENSVVNYYIGTMLDSTAVIDSENEEVIYQITMHNNADSEYIYIGALTDGTDDTLYSNSNIEYTVSLSEHVTTIGPNEDLIFTVTFAYKSGASTSNNTLNSKINFRFREKPVIELSNEGQTYTLKNIYPGYISQEYEFTVKNHNETYTNGVETRYIFETTMTAGSPLAVEIYDASGDKVTGNMLLVSDGTSKTTQKYTAKLIWDSSKYSTEYEGKNYTCNIKLIATPTDTKYLDYTIEKEFNIEVTTCKHTYEDGICTICGYVCNPHTWKNGTCTKCGKICIHNYVNGVCTICGFQEGVYAILYSDGDLHFNTTGRLDATKTEAGKTVLMQSSNIKSTAMTAATSQPWYSNVAKITSVTIEEKINPTNTAFWFYGLTKLTTINNISNLNTAKVTSMQQMFRNCSAITTLDLSSFNTTNVTNMSNMFNGCSKLITLDVANFNTAKVTNMRKYL